MKEAMDLSEFPGGALVAKGLSDVQEGILSQEALLVRIAQPRLEALGFKLNSGKESNLSSEHRLYEALEKTHGTGAHSAYNALIRKVVSFSRAYSATLRARAS